MAPAAATARACRRSATAPRPTGGAVDRRRRATPLAVDEARRGIEEAADRDGIFESLCRGARARLPFAAS